MCSNVLWNSTILPTSNTLANLLLCKSAESQAAAKHIGVSATSSKPLGM